MPVRLGSCWIVNKGIGIWNGDALPISLSYQAQFFSISEHFSVVVVCTCQIELELLYPLRELKRSSFKMTDRCQCPKPGTAESRCTAVVPFKHLSHPSQSETGPVLFPAETWPGRCSLCASPGGSCTVSSVTPWLPYGGSDESAFAWSAYHL